MNDIEFKKALDKFNIDFIIGSREVWDEKYEDVYSWRGINIVFGGLNCAIITGCIPYEVARILSKKYPDYRDDLRIDGTYGYGKVRDKEEYPKDEMGNSYIETYHVYSIEGLVYLLSEIKYFYEVRTFTEESRKKFYREQKEIIASVYRELIENVNPSYTIEEFKRDHGISSNKECGEISELVSQFDETVNPYINSEAEIKDPREFLDKAKMTIYYDEVLNSFWMGFKDGGVIYIRNQDNIRNQNNIRNYLQYDLFYEIKPDCTMDIMHTITDEHDEICLLGDFPNKGTIKLRYDMRSGLVHSIYGEERHPITEEERELFISELNKALKVGQKLILHRMTKKKNNLAKKLK